MTKRGYLSVTAVAACSNQTDLEGWRTLDCGCGLDLLIPWYGPVAGWRMLVRKIRLFWNFGKF